MSKTDLTDITIIILLLAIFVLIYFLPSIIAEVRKHSHKWAIFFLNLLAGGTGVGWIAAFVWAFIGNPPLKDNGKPTVAQELKELAELKEQGIITEEEFETKKNQWLKS